MSKRGFQDLKDEIRDAAGVSQASVGSQMGYRPEEFSRVLGGHQPPKGGLTPEEFRVAVRRTIKSLQREAVAR